MGYGTDDGQTYENRLDYLSQTSESGNDKGLDVDRAGLAAEKPRQERLYVSPNDLRPLGANIEDKRSQTNIDKFNDFKDWIGDQLTTNKVQAILQHPLGNVSQTMTANQPVTETPLGNDLGLKSITPNLPDVKDIQPNFAEDLFGKGEQDIRPKLNAFYEQVKNAFKLPGDVYGGKIDPSSQQGIERAADLAGLVVMGPAPVARKMADGTLGSFAGVKSATINKSNLAHANALDITGNSPNTIHAATGFHKGLDNKWRYEIDDSTAKFNNNWTHEADITDKLHGRTSTLSEILDHPELYKAYPQLKDIKVSYDPDLVGAEYVRGTNEINVGPGFNNKGTILHETQHAIQDIEGFSPGGAPASIPKEYDLKYGPDVRAMAPEAEALLDKSMNEGLTPAEEGRMQYLRQVLEKFMEYRKAADNLAHDYYERIAGETEARNVTRRELLTKNERARMKPWWTQDRSTDTQIHIDEPAYGTAYGVIHPKTGEYITSRKNEGPNTKFPVIPKNAEEELEQLMENRRTNKLMGYDTEGEDYKYYNDRIKELQNQINRKPTSMRSQPPPTEFRRAANDNPSKFEDIRDLVESKVKEGKVSRDDADEMLDSLFAMRKDVYNPNDRNMIGNNELDLQLDKMWSDLNSKLSRGQEVLKQIADIQRKPELNDIDIARLKKLKKEHEDLFRPSK